MKTDTIRDLRAQLQHREAEVASLRVVLEQNSLQHDNLNRDLQSLDQSGKSSSSSKAAVVRNQDVDPSAVKQSPRVDDKQGLLTCLRSLYHLFYHTYWYYRKCSHC